MLLTRGNNYEQQKNGFHLRKRGDVYHLRWKRGVLL